tara:strand:- start:17895 stop:18464 length:570 start_codon:yes stop_codon:yes gene_type:complete
MVKKSNIRAVFDNISDKLKALTNDRGERVFKTVDLNRGQMQQLKGFENIGQLIVFPAVFFKPEEIRNIPRPNNIYVTEMRIRIYVVTSNLVYSDPLDIFDLPELVDRTMLNSKWDTVNLTSIFKGFDVMPETFDNNQIYELNYWVKFWNVNAYRYADYVDANDPKINPEAPIELDLDVEINDNLPYPEE